MPRSRFVIDRRGQVLDADNDFKVVVSKGKVGPTMVSVSTAREKEPPPARTADA